MENTKTCDDYIAELNRMYQEHYRNGKCPYYSKCFSSAVGPSKFEFDYAAKVGADYGKPGIPKVLIVGQEGKSGHTETGKTSESIEQNNEHYRKTLYTLALLLGDTKPASFSANDLKSSEELLKKFCLTNYYKCALQGNDSRACRSLPHTKEMKGNCHVILEKEIEILEPDLVIIQGKFTPKAFWNAFGEGKRIAGNRTEADDTLSLYRYDPEGKKPFYIIYSYHPCYFRAWSGELLEQFEKIIEKFLKQK